MLSHLTPSVDFMAAFNVGDRKLNGHIAWSDVDDFKTDIHSEVIDNSIYGGSIGLNAQSKNFKFMGSASYLTGEHITEFSVNLTARY